MKILALLALLLCGCAVPGLAPLELQEPKKEPFAVDVGNPSLVCLHRGQVLRYVLIEGEEATYFRCADPPQQPGTKS